MKKIIYLALAMIAGVMMLESFGEIKLGKRDGTEPGHTGSPGDTLKNCTICHGGLAYQIDGWITSDVPETGYVPGTTYTVTATNTEHGATRFGFQVSPQAIDGTLLGTLLITDTTTTQLVGNKKYVTYRAAGVDGIDSRSWSFDWTAPAKGTGEVVFYGAFNSNPGHKSEDYTYLSKLTLKENSNTGLSSIGGSVHIVTLYPNPVSNSATLYLDLKRPAYVKADLFDMNGKLIAPIINGVFNGAVHKNINTASLAPGNYFVRLTAGNKTVTEKLIISH